jgi:hypothetical protein
MHCSAKTVTVLGVLHILSIFDTNVNLIYNWQLKSYLKDTNSLWTQAQECVGRGPALVRLPLNIVPPQVFL